MSSVASTSAPNAAKANSKAENCRETRAMRNSAAANSSAGKVSRDSSSSARTTKRRLKEQQQHRPTTRSSRRRKLSSASNCSSSDGIDEGESDDDKDCGGAVAVESEPDNVSSTATSLKKENRSIMQGDNTKLATDSYASSSHDMEGGDCGLITPWRMRRKRKLQTERSAVTKQDDERSDRRNFGSSQDTEERKSESISLNDSKVPTNAFHNPKLDETNIDVCKSANTSGSPPFDKANTNPIETELSCSHGNCKPDVIDSKEILKENLQERSSKTPTLNEPGVAQEVTINNCSSMTNGETQSLSARDTEDFSCSLKIDGHTKVYPRSEEHKTLQVIQKLDEKEAIGSPVIKDTIVNEREGCLNVLLVGGVEKETTSTRNSDDGAGTIIDPSLFTEEQQKLQRLTEELDERIILHQSSASSPSVVNTVDDLAVEPSQQTATTIADPCDAEEPCSKIGCTAIKMATPDKALIHENLTVAEQRPASLSLEILNSRPDAESCDSSRNSSETGDKPVIRCIDVESSTTDNAAQETATAAAASRRPMNRFSNTRKFDLVDTIKVAIHAEASQIHRGTGANKLFSEYLERLGVYLSNASSLRSRRRMASTSCSANVSASVVSGSGIETFFNFFLKTKRLRTMHNKLIMVLMKYSMEAQVPHDFFCSHIPHQWLHKVTEASSTKADEDTFTTEPDDVKIHHQRTELMNQIRHLKSCFSTESGLWAQCDTSNVLFPPPLCTLNEVKVKSEHEDSSILPSGTLPGALTIDPLVRKIAQREGISVDEYALWLIIIATRQFALEILQRAVNERSNFGIAFNSVILESRSGDAKPCTISTQDLALLAAKSRTIYGNKFSINSSSSRVFMDRLVNAAGRRMFPCPPEAPKGVQQAIVQLIQAASYNSQAEASALAYGKTLGKSFGGPEPDSNAQQLISPASINPTSTEPEMLRPVSGKDDTPKADEEKNGSEKLAAPVASDIPRKRAGGKDLAALRARRMASTQPEQPSQESAVVANVGAAMSTTQLD